MLSALCKNQARLVLTAAAFGLSVAAAETSPAPIDWEKARELHQKAASGAALAPEEQAYLDRAMAARRGRSPLAALMGQLSPAEQQQARTLMRKREAGEPLNNEDLALQAKIQGLLQKQGGRNPAPRAGRPSQAPRDHTGLVPLNEMLPGQNYKDRDGGLYGAYRNEPPPEHARAALAEAARIVPLDATGTPVADPTADSRGKIVLLSVGMSNTTQEFSRFKEKADRDAAKSPQVVVVDGAQGGQAAAQWAASPDSRIWRTVDERLQEARVTPAQVQVVWLKQAEIRPTQPFPRDAEILADDEARIVRMLKAKFKNLRLAYLSSRIYAGYATTALNPEPYAYESAFAVRDLIQRQMAGDAALNWDPTRGPVRAPLLLWGPYLWADGILPRKSDGLTWQREDLREDGTHPSATSGRDKVATLLLSFFKRDPTAQGWFVKR